MFTIFSLPKFPYQFSRKSNVYLPPLNNAMVCIFHLKNLFIFNQLFMYVTILFTNNFFSHLYQKHNLYLSMFLGAWQATVHEVAKSQTWLSNWIHSALQKRLLINSQYCNLHAVDRPTWVTDTLWFTAYTLFEMLYSFFLTPRKKKRRKERKIKKITTLNPK